MQKGENCAYFFVQKGCFAEYFAVPCTVQVESLKIELSIGGRNSCYHISVYPYRRSEITAPPPMPHMKHKLLEMVQITVPIFFFYFNEI